MKAKSIIFIAAFLCAVGLLVSWLAEPSFEQTFWERASHSDSVGNAPRDRQAYTVDESLIQYSTAEQFSNWQAATRNAYQQALNFNPVIRLDYRVEMLAKSNQRGGIRREYFELVAADGVRVPGVLQYPVNKKNLPAIIVIPGHTKPGSSGLRQLVEDPDSYQRAAATKLAQAGYATIALELRGFGLLGPPNYPEHKIVAYNELLSGSSYKGKVLSDLAALHQYLADLDFVDSARIGVTGASLGGELAVALGAAIPAIKSIVFSSYVEQGKFARLGATARKQPHYCHLIPRVGEFMRKEDVFKLLAPRSTKGIRETNIINQFQDFTEELTNVWSLLDASNHFEFEQRVNGRHQFYLGETIDYFNRFL